MHRLTMLTPCLLGMAISAQAAVVAVLDYEKTLGSKGIIETLRQDGSHEVKVIAEIAAEHLGDADVLIISHMYDLNQREVVREFVRQGGGVLLTHDAAGSGRPFSGSQSHGKAESTFPEISDSSVQGYMVSNPRVKAIGRHPITEGIGDAVFNYSFTDHATLTPVDDRMVIIEDSESDEGFTNSRFWGTQLRWDAYLGGNAVLIAAPFGQGRVVLNGMLPGLSPDYKSVTLQGGERTLLLNSVNWLSGATALKVPKTVKASSPSKYSRQVSQKAPPYREKAISVETKVVVPVSQLSKDQSVRFQLPESVSPGRSVPVVMDVPAGSVPRAVSVVQSDGTISESVPVQIEIGDDGKAQLVFIESFPARDVTAVLGSAETLDSAPLEVKVNAEGTLAKITGPHFSLLVGCEGDEPTLQCVRIHDWDWHHTWDGIERNNLSAPILRLAESLWPFKATPPSIDHEVGMPFPEVAGDAAKTFKFPVRATLRVGKGRLTVYRTGQVHLKNFARAGRVATFLVDRYVSDGRVTPETVSYDLPAVRGKWFWALRDHRYALGGTFDVLDKMGETGLAPGMERMVSLSGDTLVLTTDVEDLARYQVAAVPCLVKTKDVPSVKRTAGREPETPLTYPTVKVSQRRLLKMRGTDDFFEILAQPVEIYSDLLGKTTPVAKWQIDGDDNVQIGASMVGPFGNTVEDPMVIEQIKRGDPHKEDSAVWRRLYLRCRKITDLKTTPLTLTGTNKKGETVVVVPVEMHQALSLPVGVFTYGPQWISYWYWAGKKNGRCLPDQWPKIMRNIALNGLDYTIHTTIEEQPEGATEVQSRLERYGLWWMASLQQAYRGGRSKEHVEPFYSEHIPRWKDAPNVIAWYLSDEQASGEVENGVLPPLYRSVKLFYDLCKKYDDKKRPAINLITPSSTSYETSTRYLPSDMFSWDPYGQGAGEAYETAAKVDTMWRKTKNKPSWITLRVCGPNWIDCLDLWLDIRRRSLASVRGNVDGINYFGYSHWLSDMESNSWYAVIPGTKGPIATPRWQAVKQIIGDIDLLTTVEYLIDSHREKGHLVQKLDKAKLAGQEGRFYTMRTQLDEIIGKARQQ